VKLYLAGPMRGYPDNNAAAFHAAAFVLRDMGHTVWSPAEHDKALADDADALDIRRTFVRDLTALLECDAVVLLDGWPGSHGACLERHAADVCGVPVYALQDFGMVRMPARDWRRNSPGRPSYR